MRYFRCGNAHVIFEPMQHHRPWMVTASGMSFRARTLKTALWLAACLELGKAHRDDVAIATAVASNLDAWSGWE